MAEVEEKDPQRDMEGEASEGKAQSSSVEIYNKLHLGTGCFGKVYRAKYGQLPCAAKLLHTSVFNFGNDKNAKSSNSNNDNNAITQRVEQECRFLWSLKHTHLVQYLSIITEAQTCGIVVIMELMDENLTRLLEQSLGPLPYHKQIKICYDIALALSYLHSIKIVHGNLSSNNVLVNAGCIAKVSDYGYSRLLAVRSQHDEATTPHTPLTTAYLPPEVFTAPPHCTNKVDCFSHGVLTIQVATKMAPMPTPSQGENGKYPPVPSRNPMSELERRKADIDKLEPRHPLIPTALESIQDREIERPTADKLCQKLSTLLKAEEKYLKSVGKIKNRMTALPATLAKSTTSLQDVAKSNDTSLLDDFQAKLGQMLHQINEKDEDIMRKDEIISINEEIIRERVEKIASLEETLNFKEEIIANLRQKLRDIHDQARTAMTAESATTNHHLDNNSSSSSTPENSTSSSETSMERSSKKEASMEKSIRKEVSSKKEVSTKEVSMEKSSKSMKEASMEEKNSRKEVSVEGGKMENSGRKKSSQEDTPTSPPPLKSKKNGDKKKPTHHHLQPLPHISWKIGQPAPNSLTALRGSAVVHCNRAYFSLMRKIFCFTLTTSKWFMLPECTQSCFGLTVVQDQLVAVGGYVDDDHTVTTNTLTGLTPAKIWDDILPPMATKRASPAVVATPTHLVVAGGKVCPPLFSEEGLSAVEVLDLDQLQWTMAAGCCLPKSLERPLMVLHEEQLFIGDLNSNSMHTCHLTALLQEAQTSATAKPSSSSSSKQTKKSSKKSEKQKPLWRKTANFVQDGGAALIVLGSHILAIGGRYSNHNKPSGAILSYNKETNSWKEVGQLPRPVWDPLVTYVPGSKLLLVVGGCSSTSQYSVGIDVGKLSNEESQT